MGALCLSLVCSGAAGEARDHAPEVAEGRSAPRGAARLLAPDALRELARRRAVAADGSVTLLFGQLAAASSEPGAAAAPTQAALEETARRFLQGRLEELTGAAGSSAPGIAFEPYFQVDEGLLALHARQLWNDVEVMDSRLAFVFAGRMLVSFAGRVRPPRETSRTTALDALQALGALERGTAFRRPADGRLRSVGERQFLVEDGDGRAHLELSFVVDPETAEAVWLATRGSKRWTIGAGADERVVSRGSVRGAVGYSSVQIRHGDARVGTKDWMSSLSSLAPIDGTMSVHREDIGPGQCGYSLRYDDFRTNGISPQVQYYSPTSGWTSWRPVSDCDGFDFVSNLTSRYRQQHYYWWLRRAGDYVRSAAYGTFAPISDWDVGLAVNWPTGSCGPNFSACFEANPWSRWIHLTESSSGQQPSLKTLFHEYGHYFGWTYGGLSENCRDGDEGNALDETIGDSIALIVGKRYFEPSYGDLGAAAFYGEEEEFPLVFTSGTMGCYLAGDEHNMGKPFVQAIWQVLFDANCADTQCQVTLTGIRGDLGWPSAASARDHTLKSLAYALKILPASTTHEQVVAFMYMYLLTHTDITLANNVMRVFNRHGL